MKHLIHLLIFINCFSTFCQSDLKTITHEDMWKMRRVGAPALSPDGKWVVFSVQDPSYNDKEVINDIWIAPTNGLEKPRRLTALKAAESNYVFSPDGSKLAFTAKRDGEEESQIYILNMNGGEAQKFSQLSSGASNPKWNHDGSILLFTSNVHPGCHADSLQKKKAEEIKNLKYKARVYESFPIRNWDKWLDEKVSYLFVQHIDSTQAICLFKDVPMSAKAGFSCGRSSWLSKNEIIFAASTDENTTAYQASTSHLYKVNIKGGDAIKLTSEANISFTNPLVSEDGKFVYCYENKIEYKVYSLDKLVRYDYPTMKNKTIISTIDRPVTSIDIINGKIFATLENEGRDRIYELTNEAPVEISKIKSGSYSNVMYRNNVTVANYESMIRPPEIVILNNDGGHSFITQFNQDKLSKLDLKDAETFWTTTSRGKKIRSMLVRPAKFDKNKKYPLFVMMHGGPAISYKESWGYRWHPYVIAGEDFVVVMTDYTGSTGYGEKFSQDIQYDPFKGPAQEINEAAADAIKRFDYIDSKRQAAGGASYGGHLANWMQASTTHYKCLIAHAGLVNSVSQWGTSDYIYGREVMNGGVPWEDSKVWVDQNPMKFAKNFKTPILFTVGELDYRVPVNNTIESFHIHQRLKVPSKLIVFPEENHWILKAENSKFHYKEIRAWLNKWLN